MLICGKCGHQNDDLARICLECGARFDGREGSATFTIVEEKKSGFQHDPFAKNVSDGPTDLAPLTEKDLDLEPLMPKAETKVKDFFAQKKGLHAKAAPREPLMVLLFCVISCYLPYYIYWWYMVAKEIKAALGRENINPTMELVLNILTCSLYSIWLSYKYPKLMVEMEERVNLPPKDISVMSMVLTLVSFGPIAAYLIQKDLNRIWEGTQQD